MNMYIKFSNIILTNTKFIIIRFAIKNNIYFKILYYGGKHGTS